MEHAIYRITAVRVTDAYTLEITFDDATTRTINFEHLLYGEMYSPLRNLSLFNCVSVDPEVHTITWPNGADFDPATLHDWEDYDDEITRRAREWKVNAR